MEIRVLLFAALAERAGFRERRLVLGEGASAADAWSALVRETPALADAPRPLVALDRAYCAADSPLREGAELAFLPPIAGG